MPRRAVGASDRRSRLLLIALGFTSPAGAQSFDCRNAGGEVPPNEGTPTPAQAHAGCFEQAPLPFLGNTLKFTHVNPADYSHP